MVFQPRHLSAAHAPSADLAVPTKATLIVIPACAHAASGLEFSGSSLNHLFAQRRNLLRPRFYRMLAAINRFNSEAVAALDDPATKEETLGDYVTRRAYGEDFFQLYLVPMSSAVWSTPPELMLAFPATTLLRFFHNHGFLGLHTQHPWWTVEGGAKTYVEKNLRAVVRDRLRPAGQAATASSAQLFAARWVIVSTDAPAASVCNSTKSSSPATATRPCGCSISPPRMKPASWASSSTSRISQPCAHRQPSA